MIVGSTNTKNRSPRSRTWRTRLTRPIARTLPSRLIRGVTRRRARASPSPPVTAAMSRSTPAAGRQSATVPPAPAISPRPRRNQACGVISATRAMTSGAVFVGANVPPRMPSVIATAELAAPAASAVWKNETTRVEIPVAARMPARTMIATPSGGPQSALISTVVATTSTVIETTACRKPPRSLPHSTSDARSGLARIRRSVPRSRSPKMRHEAHLRRQEQEQGGHRRRVVRGQGELAQVGGLVDDRDGGRRGGGLPGDPRDVGLGQRRGRHARRGHHRQLDPDDAVGEPLRDRTRDLGRQAGVPRAPTTSSVTACPAWIAAVNPDGTRKAASAVPSSTAARAAASVGDVGDVRHARLLEPADDVVPQHLRERAAVHVRDHVGRVELDGRAQQLAEDHGEPERGDDRHEDRRPVAQPLAEVLGRDDERDAHDRRARYSASRRARPVRWRKTASRLGWTSSTPRTWPPAVSTASSTRGSARPASRVEHLDDVAAGRRRRHARHRARGARRGQHVAAKREPDLLALADQRHELLARPLGADLAAVDDPDAVAEALGLLHVVGRVEDRHAAGPELGDGLEDRVAALGVDAHGRLVEEQEPWLVEQPDADVQAPLHPAAVVLDPVARAFGEPDEREHLVDPRSGGPARRGRTAARRTARFSRPERSGYSASSWGT